MKWGTHDVPIEAFFPFRKPSAPLRAGYGHPLRKIWTQ